MTIKNPNVCAKCSTELRVWAEKSQDIPYIGAIVRSVLISSDSNGNHFHERAGCITQNSQEHCRLTVVSRLGGGGGGGAPRTPCDRGIRLEPGVCKVQKLIGCPGTLRTDQRPQKGETSKLWLLSRSRAAASQGEHERPWPDSPLRGQEPGQRSSPVIPGTMGSER